MSVQNNHRMFKNGDFKMHILNEKNMYVTEQYINNILSNYNIKHTVRKLNNFQIALTHISYLNTSVISDKTANLLKNVPPIASEHLQNVVPLLQRDYNLFEYYGDSLIHFIITKYLYIRYPGQDCGFLTRFRTKLEKAQTLSFLSKKLGLHKYVMIARNLEYNLSREQDVHLTEDIFEAFVWALYLEASFTICYDFVIAVFEQELDFAELLCVDDNYKEKLMQYFHKLKLNESNKCTLKYIEADSKKTTSNNCYNQEIIVRVYNEDVYLGIGKGNTKNKAEQAAAHDALTKLADINLIKKDITLDNYDHLFKDNNYQNHILNENNIYITCEAINEILNNYSIKPITSKSLKTFQTALIHSSYLVKNQITEKIANQLKEIKPIECITKSIIPLQTTDNSRLVHLGNAFVRFVLTEYLYTRYANKDQGFLTRFRAKIEQSDTLYQLINSLNLNKYIIIAREYNPDNTLLKNIFEAFIASLLLTNNYDNCKKFIITLLEQELDFAELLQKDDNYKEQLMQFCHKKRWAEAVYIDKTEKIDNTNINKSQIKNLDFVIHIEVNNNLVGIGTDKSKYKAEQKAAYYSLIKLGAIIINDDSSDSEYYE